MRRCCDRECRWLQQTADGCWQRHAADGLSRALRPPWQTKGDQGDDKGCDQLLGHGLTQEQVSLWLGGFMSIANKGQCLLATNCIVLGYMCISHHCLRVLKLCCCHCPAAAATTTSLLAVAPHARFAHTFTGVENAPTAICHPLLLLVLLADTWELPCAHAAADPCTHLACDTMHSKLATACRSPLNREAMSDTLSPQMPLFATTILSPGSRRLAITAWG